MPARIKALPVEAPVKMAPGAEEMWKTGTGIWAHRPKIYQAYSSLYTARAEEGTLSPRLCELLRLRIAFHNQCRSCMAFRHAPDAVTEGDVCSLEKPEEASDLTPRERAALHFADLFATNHLAIDEKVFDGLRQHFSEGELVELGAWCALCVGFGRMMASWHLVDALPASYKAGLDKTETPWGHDDAYTSKPPEEIAA